MFEISPGFSSTTMTTAEEPLLIQRTSSNLFRSGRLTVISPSTESRSSSTSSINFAEGDVDVVTEDGLHHASVKLEARQYKSPNFTNKLLGVLSTLQILSWTCHSIDSSVIRIHKVSGSLTNAVFFVSYPSLPTLLLRIYGPSSDSMISRPRELHTLHILSSTYHIGPKVYGTFENGRIEEYFDSVTLTPSDLRNPQISRWIGARMAELHLVDIEVVEETSPAMRGEGQGWEIGAKMNVRSWLAPARDVLSLPSVSDTVRRDLNLDSFLVEWESYIRWVAGMELNLGVSRRVFAHNDTQYGNLLRLTNVKPGAPGHRQIIVVDFEYASPNPAAFDIANHFHEWTADYHSSTPHILDPSRYPAVKERRNFYAAYLEHSTVLMSKLSFTQLSEQAQELEIRRLDHQVRVWSPASHAMWAIWGIVQAREDLEGNATEPEFDYISYAQCRMAGFRREINQLGL